MTTPVGKDTMPYGVTVEGDGNSKDARILAPHPRRDSASYLQLEPGPVRVAVSWEGPEEMRAYVYNRGTRQGRVVATIPARSGGGCVLRLFLSARSKATWSSFTASRLLRPSVLAAPSRSTPCPSSEPQGGGLDDHTVPRNDAVVCAEPEGGRAQVRVQGSSGGGKHGAAAAGRERGFGDLLIGFGCDRAISATGRNFDKTVPSANTRRHGAAHSSCRGAGVTRGIEHVVYNAGSETGGRQPARDRGAHLPNPTSYVTRGGGGRVNDATSRRAHAGLLRWAAEQHRKLASRAVHHRGGREKCGLSATRGLDRGSQLAGEGRVAFPGKRECPGNNGRSRDAEGVHSHRPDVVQSGYSDIERRTGGSESRDGYSNHHDPARPLLTAGVVA